MDIFTFLNSTSVLFPYFERCVRQAMGGTLGPEELLAALLTLDGASLTSGEVEELRRTCLAQGGTQESPGGTSPAGAR